MVRHRSYPGGSTGGAVSSPHFCVEFEVAVLRMQGFIHGDVVGGQVVLHNDTSAEVMQYNDTIMTHQWCMMLCWQ